MMRIKKNKRGETNVICDYRQKNELDRPVIGSKIV